MSMDQFYIDVKTVCNKNNVLISIFKHEPKIQKDSLNLKSNFYNSNTFWYLEKEKFLVKYHRR